MKSFYKRCLFYIFFFFLFKEVSAKTYYVNSISGLDKNSGLTKSSSWKTIAKVNQTEFFPGDSILFKAGCTWREELVIPSGGNKNAPIIYSSYGEGDLPKIIGSEKLISWDFFNKNIWSAEKPTTLHWLWFINNEINWGNKVDKIIDLKRNYDFFIDSEKVYVFLSDFDDSKISIEGSIRDFGIVSGWYKKGFSNILIEKLEICFTKNANIRAIGSKEWIIKNTILHHSGRIDESDGQGIQWEGENGIFSKNEIYENGQHGIFISSFGNANVNNNIIEENKIYNNYHTAIDLMNDGGDSNSLKNIIIRRNSISDNSTFEGNEIGIQTLSYGNSKVKNIIIHHNIIQNLNGIGISIMPYSDSIFVHNNTIVETKSACINIDQPTGYIEIINNIGINNNYYAVVFLRSNLTLEIDNNIWFTNKKSSTENVFMDGVYYSDHQLYSMKRKFDVKGSFKDPQLSNIGNDNFLLVSSSPAINNGKLLQYKTDYYGRPIDKTIDIGAVEFIEN